MTHNNEHTALPLQIVGLSVVRGARMIVRDVSIALQSNQILGLVGPNGSGKSTLLLAIAGVLKPVAGQIQLAGYSMMDNSDRAKFALGFAPDVALLPAGLSVRQVLRLCAIARFESSQAEIPESTLSQVKRLGLERYFDSFLSTLSLGSRQKVAILIALMNAPACIILDEVFNGLDPRSSHQLKQVLRELRDQGCAIVLATHGLELAADLLDQMVLLEEGQIKARWNADQFASIRQQGGTGLEAAIVSALDEQL